MVVTKDQGAGKQPKYVGMTSECDKDCWVKAKCEAGEYTAVINAPWKRSVNTLAFSTYGPGVINLSQGGAATQPSQKSDTLVQQMLLQKVASNPSKLLNYSGKGYPGIFYLAE